MIKLILDLINGFLNLYASVFYVCVPILLLLFGNNYAKTIFVAVLICAVFVFLTGVIKSMRERKEKE